MKTTQFLLFNSTVVNLKEKSLDWYLSQISWLRASGRYVVVDPNNSDLLLYLREKEYNKLIINSIANDIQIIVIATPDDTRESIKSRFPDSTTPKLDFLVSRLSRLVSLIPGWEIKDSMIYFKRNFEYFIPYYYNDIITWLGIPSSTESRRAVRSLSKQLTRYFTYRGVNNLITVMKISSIVILKYLGNEPLTSTQSLGQRIKLVHGLPAFFPVLIRNWIRQNSINHIRVIMTLLYAYKGIRGKWGLPDVSSIQAEPYFLLERLEQELLETRDKFFKNFTREPVNFKTKTNSPPLILTASGNGSPSIAQTLFDAFFHCFDSNQNLNRYLSLAHKQFGGSMNPYTFARGIIESYVSEMKQGLFIWKVVKTFPLIKLLRRHYPKIFKNLREDKVWSHEVEELVWAHTIPGRLSLKFEAAGKVRVFAMVDYFTQYALKPLHDDLMKILKGCSSDATFYQTQRVEETLRENYRTCYSFDLKSATDLIPSQLYKIVLGSRYGDEFSHAWFNLLVDRDFVVMKSKTTSNFQRIRYTRGQPMGALSSWPALAVIHHYLVWLSAYRVNKQLANSFKSYLVLGDDLVIFDKQVAMSYLSVCKDYGITVGLPKSFVSEEGLYQFASQNVYKGEFITPLPLKDALASSMYSSVTNKFKLINNRLEFSKRINRLGYMKDSSLLSFVRAQSSYYQWKRYCKFYFQKGLIPDEVRNMILLILNLDLTQDPSIRTLDRLLAALAGNYNLLCSSNNIPSFTNQERSLFVTRLYNNILSDLLEKISEIEKDLKVVHIQPFYPYLQSLHLMFIRALGGARFNSAYRLVEIQREVTGVRHSVYKYLNDPNLIAKELDVGPLDDDIIIEKHLELINKLLVYRQEVDSLFIKLQLTDKFTDSFVNGKVNYYIGLQLHAFQELERTKATMAM